MHNVSVYDSREGHGEVGQIVRSPEQVVLHLPVAGPASRMLAYSIDFVAIMALQVGLFALLLLSTPLFEKLDEQLRSLAGEVTRNGPDRAAGSAAFLYLLAFFIVLQFVVELAYFVAWEVLSGGRSLGKLLVGLRVVRDGGMRISPFDSVLRNLLRMVDMLPLNYVVGLVSMVVSPEGKRLGDLAAGTVVIRLDGPARALPLVAADGDALGGFRFERSQLERIGANELRLIRQTLRRLDSLSAEQAEVVLEKAAAALCQRLGHAPLEPDQRRAFLLALLRAAETR